MTARPTAFASTAVVDTLRWICDVLRREQIPFQVGGAIAAVAHGAKRSASGVELFIRAEHLPRLMRVVKDRIVDHPWRHRTDQWDLVAMVLKANGVRVSIGIADGARVRTEGSDEWRDAAVDVTASERLTVEQIEIPVAPRAQLVDRRPFGG